MLSICIYNMMVYEILLNVMEQKVNIVDAYIWLQWHYIADAFLI